MRDVVVRSTRHLLSTTLTTVVGFMPLLPGGGDFWPPLATSIAGGVSGATILAIYFDPSGYVLLMCRGCRDRQSKETQQEQTMVARQAVARPLVGRVNGG